MTADEMVDALSARLERACDRIEQATVLIGILAAENTRLRDEAEGFLAANKTLWQERGQAIAENAQLRAELGAARAMLLTLSDDGGES